MRHSVLHAIINKDLPLFHRCHEREKEMLSDIEIAQKAEMKPIVEIGEKVGIAPENLENYGPYKAKLSLKFTNEVLSKPQES